MTQALKFFKQYKIEFIVFGLIFILKALIFLSFSTTITPDSGQYMEMNGFDIFSLQLNERRVPLYPMLLDICQQISADHFYGIVCSLQFIISAISMIYFYKTLCLIDNKRYLNISFVAMYALCDFVLGWDRTILTESIALSLTIFIIYHLIQYLKAPNIKSAIFITLLTTFGVMFRPSMLLFIFVITAFFVLRFIFVKNERKIAFRSLIISIFAIVVVFGYALLFSSQHGNFSISNCYLSQQDEVMTANTELYKLSKDKDMVQIITEAKDNGGSGSKALYAAGYTKKDFSKFLNDIKKDNPKEYCKYLLKVTKNNFNTRFFGYYTLENEYIKLFLTSYLNTFGITFGQGMVICLICFIFLLYKAKKYRKFSWLYFGLFGFIFGIYITSLMGTNSEYPRTAILALPFCYIALWSFICKFMDLVAKTKNKFILGGAEDDLL